MSSGYYSLKRVDSLFKNEHVHDSGIIANSISDILSSASNNKVSTATTNTTAAQSSYIQSPPTYTQSPPTYISSNVSNNVFNTPFSTTTGRYIPPAGRVPSTHHTHSIANSSSTRISNQNHNHQSCNTLTHPNQLFSAPYRPSPQSLYTQRGVNPPPSLHTSGAQNPPPSLYPQQSHRPPPGLNTQRGQYPAELFWALLYQDRCPGCVHESLWPRDFSTYHWPVCPVNERRVMAGWRRDCNGKESTKEVFARYRGG